MTGRARVTRHGMNHAAGGSDPIPGAGAVTWEDVGSGAQTMVLPAFANTCFNVTVDDSPMDFNSGTATMHFSTTDDDTFDTSSGQARILRSGLYQIGLQIEIENTNTTSGDTGFELQIGYGSSGFGTIGYGIEVPWLGFSSLNTMSEQILGTYFIYPDGTASSYAVALQRIHPISVDDDIFPAFPLEIHSLLYAGDTSGIYTVRSLGLWGFRISDALDSSHSD